ncbi:hypothetical protein AHIS1_p032 [Acaryochloris phage A-HIS1]|nr:hypothetical protein AHIS1_p032 [Acaryochloris phage A-HIS1]
MTKLTKALPEILNAKNPIFAAKLFETSPEYLEAVTRSEVTVKTYYAYYEITSNVVRDARTFHEILDTDNVYARKWALIQFAVNFEDVVGPRQKYETLKTATPLFENKTFRLLMKIFTTTKDAIEKQAVSSLIRRLMLIRLKHLSGSGSLTVAKAMELCAWLYGRLLDAVKTFGVRTIDFVRRKFSIAREDFDSLNADRKVEYFASIPILAR